MKIQMKLLGYVSLSFLVPSSSFGYGYFTLTAGRKDFANRYGVAPALMYPAQAGAVYDFGKWAEFNTLPPGVTNAIVTAAINDATNDWSKWANIKYDTSGFNASGTGRIRLRHDAARAEGAFAYAYAGATPGEVDYAEIVFGNNAAAGVPWDARNFAWTVKHEMGHQLGLVDLYEDQTEDFADHKPGELDSPNLTYASRKDNIMYQYNFGNDYSKAPVSVIDNDEIFGITALWGSANSQIYTGALANAYNNNGRLGSADHHGPQQMKWWTYSGTFGSQKNLVTNEYIDITFAGFTGNFNAKLLGAGAQTLTYDGPQGNNVHRFKTSGTGFIGNFELKMESVFAEEGLVDASVVSGANGISFSLDPNQDGLTYSQNIAGGKSFAKVFGPVPEPASLIVIGAGISMLLKRKRKEKEA